MSRPRFVRLADELVRQRPDLDADAAARAIASGHVVADGRILHNLESRVPRGCRLVVQVERPLRGEEKLGHVLDHFDLPVRGATCLDVGANAGGFTRALLDRGAATVVAVDVGHGQLAGSLRQDDRVVNLEATNVADLDRTLVPDAIGGVSIDVSYLSLTKASACIASLAFTDDAWLAGLVKPMFELGRPSLPTERADLDEATRLAAEGVGAAGWRVLDTVESSVRGANGAIEFFVIATRR